MKNYLQEFEFVVHSDYGRLDSFLRGEMGSFLGDCLNGETKLLTVAAVCFEPIKNVVPMDRSSVELVSTSSECFGNYSVLASLSLMGFIVKNVVCCVQGNQGKRQRMLGNVNTNWNSPKGNQLILNVVGVDFPKRLLARLKHSTWQ